MALATKVILQVNYPDSENSYKTMAFAPSLSIEECRDMAAKKVGIPAGEKELYGLFDPSSNQWLQLGDNLEKYNLQNRANVEFRQMPDEHTVYFDGQTLTPRLNYQAPVSEVIASITEQLGEKPADFLLLANNDGDTAKGTLLDLKKPLIEQAKPGKTNLILKRKKAGIFKSKSRASVIVPQNLQARKMFGQQLELITNPKAFDGLPPVVAKCIEFLEAEHLELEGIFRISGNQMEVAAMKAAFDDGKDVDVTTASSPHVVSGLLKLFFRDMPEPLFTFSLYEVFLSIQTTVKNPEAKVLYHKVLIEALPEPNRVLLFRLLPYLARVIEREAVNKMAIHNVATVFGPNLLRSEDESPMTLIQDTAAINGITCDLIKHQELICGEAEHDFISVGKATYGYTGQTESELTFVTGDLVFVVKEDDTGWWEGEINGQYGFFPTNYVKIILQLPSHSANGGGGGGGGGGGSEGARGANAKPAGAAAAPKSEAAAPAAAQAQSAPPAAAASVQQNVASAAAAAVAAKQAAPKAAQPAAAKPVQVDKPVEQPKRVQQAVPVQQQEAPVQQQAAPAQQKAAAPVPTLQVQQQQGSPGARKSAAGGGPGGLSKKQFMSELDSMKKGIAEERAGRLKLEKAIAVILGELKTVKAVAHRNSTQVKEVANAPSPTAPSPAPAAGATIPPRLLEDVEDLKADAMVLQEEVESLQEFKRDLQTTISTLSSQIAKLEEEKDSLAADVAALQESAQNRPPMRGGARGRPILRGAPRGRPMQRPQ